MTAMLFPLVLGIASLIVAAIVFIGGFAEERRNEGIDADSPLIGAGS